MNANFVLISEIVDNLKLLQKYSCLRRSHDNIPLLSAFNIKILPQNTDIVFLPAQEYSRDDLFRIINHVLKHAPKSKIILLTDSDTERDFILECFKIGIYDFINTNCAETDFYIRIRNCLKLLKIERMLEISNIFYNTPDTVSSKTGLYTRKALKEVFDDLADKDYVREGTFCVLTFDASVRTKVSLNRLGAVLKKRLRRTDIIAAGTDKFYIIFTDTSPYGAKSVLSGISIIMGEDLIIRAGLSKIGLNNYDTVVARANDSLKSAELNDEMCVCIDGGLSFSDISDNMTEKSHHFKLFQKAFEQKLDNVIKPVFFRFEKDFKTKLSKVEVIQYANETECAFCIKSNDSLSELNIRYDGFAKLNLTISHSGLDTPETTDIKIPLNKFNERILTKFLKQLLKEFKEGAKNA